MNCFEKLALNLRTADKVIGLIKSKYPIKRILMPDLARMRMIPTLGAVSVEGLKNSTMKVIAPSMKKPFIVASGGPSFFHHWTKGLGGPQSLSPTSKRMLRNIALMHEAAELQASGKKAFPSYFSHMGPEVLLNESNIVASLPKQHEKVRQSMIAARKATSEAGLMAHHLPGFEYGKTRLSRHAIKRAKVILQANVEKAAQRLARYVRTHSSRTSKATDKLLAFKEKLYGAAMPSEQALKMMATPVAGRPMTVKESKMWAKEIKRIMQESVSHAH